MQPKGGNSSQIDKLIHELSFPSELIDMIGSGSQSTFLNESKTEEERTEKSGINVIQGEILKTDNKN